MTLNFNANAEPAAFLQGQLAEPGAPTHRRYGLAEIASGTLNAGDPVILGTDTERQVANVLAASVVNAQTFAGFALLDTTRAYNSTPIADGDEIAVLDEGYIALLAGGTVTRGQCVILALSTGVLTGAAAGADPGAGKVALPGCRWEADGGDGDLVKASVRLAGAAGLMQQSGVYAPTLAAVTNVDGTPTATNAMYSRNGSIVQCAMTLSVDPTAAAATVVSITLPFASDIGAVTDVTGVASRALGGVATSGGSVEGEATENGARLKFTAVGTSAEVWHVMFTYKVI
jgi:hypothetical protein